MKSPGNDTIAAIATAAGGGIGIVRVSGPDALAVATRIFRDRAGRPLASRQPFRLVLGKASSPAGDPIDEALAVHMPAGRSYTGEPTVEIQAHGGRLVLDTILQAALDAGARPAGPGEFTRRAYLCGRLDLTQAEAVAALVAAECEQERRHALQQLHGAVAERCLPLRERLVEFVSRVEAALDFEDGELPVDLPGGPEIAALAADMRTLAFEARCRTEGQGGPRIVVAGRTNAGKSSIFNYLLDRDRSIVSPSPGTTRDYIEERSSLGGASVTMVDTAGFRMTEDPVEAEGVRRSLQQLREADIVILVRDGSKGDHPDDARLLELTSGSSRVVVFSKADLPLQLDDREFAPRLNELPVHRISTLTGEGCAAFADELASRCREVSRSATAEAVAPNLRHRVALEKAAGYVDAAADLARSADGQFDQVAVELNAALLVFGEITGETATDEILDRIFSRFCVGK